MNTDFDGWSWIFILTPSGRRYPRSSGSYPRTMKERKLINLDRLNHQVTKRTKHTIKKEIRKTLCPLCLRGEKMFNLFSRQS
jgi:hypothetical protein